MSSKNILDLKSPVTSNSDVDGKSRDLQSLNSFL